MSFKENEFQQISISDSFTGLTEREQKALERSWAKVFADEIFPAIDEKRFAVLYSDKASRPNTPINVMMLGSKGLFEIGCCAWCIKLGQLIAFFNRYLMLRHVLFLCILTFQN